MTAGPSVFAVEDTAVQVTWRRLAPGAVVGAGDIAVEVEGDGGPGAVVLDGLPPGADLDLVVDEGRGRRAVASFRTLLPPPGRELFRLATVTDLHIGSTGFGHLPAARDPGGASPPPERCLNAALDELRGWGAGLVLVKGDIAHHGEAAELERAGELLAGAGVPVEAVPGNHDVQTFGYPGGPAPAVPGVGLAAGEVRAVDRPGLRIVLADTTIPGHHHGTYDRVRHEVVQLVAAAAGGALVVVHHQPQWLRVPSYWPPGIPGPEARRFLDALAEANPATVLTTGHTHRHRVRRHGPVTIVETGSPNDYPGTWTGLAVHEDGLRQVVRRVAAPEALRWNEASRRSFLGTWGRWSPGRLPDRCFTLTWPTAGGDDGGPGAPGPSARP